MKTPQLLKSGDTIGIIALSASPEESRFQAGINFIKSQGYNVKIALTPTSQYGKKDYLFGSDTPTARAKALTDLFLDPEVKAIIPARGTYGTMELLPLLNCKKLVETSKLISGFSDTTCLHSALLNGAKRRGVISIHGPSLESAFSKAATDSDAEKSAKALLAMFAGKNWNAVAEVCGELLFPQRRRASEGRLVGGNLVMLTALLGTPWELQCNGAILFLEEIGESPYRIHRMLLQLKLAGKLQSLAGVVLGSFSNCIHPKGLGPNLEEVLQNIFSEYTYPVLSNFPCGHELINLPIPLGVNARISSNRLEFIDVPDLV